MIKVTLLLAIFAATAQALPISESEISNAAESGDWNLVHQLIQQRFNDKSIWDMPAFSSGNVRSLKPSDGGQVYGESEYSFHTSSNINGQKSEKSGGHKIINDNGKVSEYDFKPNL